MGKAFFLFLSFIILNNVYSQGSSQNSNIIGDSTIQISLGETLLIDADFINGALKKIKVVTQKNEHTISIELKEVVNGKETQIVLKIANPFNENLQYNASMYLIKYNRWVNTKVIPVRAQKETFEMWSDKISAIRINSMQLKK